MLDLYKNSKYVSVGASFDGGLSAGLIFSWEQLLGRETQQRFKEVISYIQQNKQTRCDAFISELYRCW